MVVMYVVWVLVTRARRSKPQEVEGRNVSLKHKTEYWLDVVDSDTVDLRIDEFEELPEHPDEIAAREGRKGVRGWAHRMYDAIA